jgi:hypothetical protein
VSRPAAASRTVSPSRKTGDCASPAGDDRGDGDRSGVAGNLVALPPDERERGAAGDDRGDQTDQPPALDETVVERLGIEAQHGHAGERDRPADETGRERADAELPLERRFAELGGVGAEEDGGKVGGGHDSEDADQERGRVEPARELVASGVPDRDAAGSDPADRGAECERGQNRGEGKGGVDRA